MSNSYNKPKSCTGRFFGTLFAFIAAAAVVYVGSYLAVFHMTGLPVANESGWLGPKMRFLATGPYQDSEAASFYKGDTKPYEVFKPLNTAWLKTKDLPTTMPVAAAPEVGRGGEGPGSGEGEGRRGRGGRGERGERSGRFGANERLDDSSTTGSGTMERDRETTGGRGGEDGEQPRRRGNFRRGGEASMDGGTTESAGEARDGASGEEPSGERPRRRGGRRGDAPGAQPE